MRCQFGNRMIYVYVMRIWASVRRTVNSRRAFGFCMCVCVCVFLWKIVAGNLTALFSMNAQNKWHGRPKSQDLTTKADLQNNAFLLYTSERAYTFEFQNFTTNNTRNLSLFLPPSELHFLSLLVRLNDEKCFVFVLFFFFLIVLFHATTSAKIWLTTRKVCIREIPFFISIDLYQRRLNIDITLTFFGSHMTHSHTHNTHFLSRSRNFPYQNYIRQQQ